MVSRKPPEEITPSYKNAKLPGKNAKPPAAGSLVAGATLKTSADFKRIARQGRKWTGSAFTMQVLKNDSQNDRPPFRIGFTVSRRVGNAVVRNRAKRRLREMTRLFLRALAGPATLDGVEVVLIAKTAAASLAFPLLSAEFERGLAATGAAPGVAPTGATPGVSR